MLLYRLIKPYSTLGVKTFFRKIYFHNDHYIPKDKPVLITCNHPTAFLDPVIMACMLKDPIHFMVRGDVFKKPFFRRILQSLNMIPIFRFKEGYSNIKNNYVSMDYVSDLLSENQHVVIFAEGLCLQEKRLKPIQKGAARMAFSAIEKHGELDIHIVPASVNYTFKTQVRDVVKYDFGKPIRVADYLELYRDNANKAVKEITEEIERRMRQLIVHIDEKDDREVVDQVQELISNNINAPQFPIKDRDIVPLRYDRLVANTVNDMHEVAKNNLKSSATDYFVKLSKYGVTDYGVLHAERSNVFARLNLFLGFLPNLIGMVLGRPFWMYGKKVAKKKSKDIEYFSSLWFGVCFFSFLLFYIFWILAAIIVQKLFFTLFVVMIPYFCFFHISYQDYLHRIRQARTASSIPPAERQLLIEERARIIKMVIPS